MRKSVGKILRKCHLNSKYKGYLYIQDSVDIMHHSLSAYILELLNIVASTP